MIASSRSKAFALLSGVIVGFLLAIAVGYHLNDYSKPGHFKRFHQRISPEGLFYPTFTMLENLALAGWSPGKTMVIIGGSSVLKGVGQTEPELWSSLLQKELGNGYAVVNLAFSGGAPGEGGALVTESMIRRGVPVIYVADSGPLVRYSAYGNIYGYLYWDALYKHRLLPFPARDAACAQWEKSLLPKERTQQQELQRSAQLDAFLHFQALWETAAYRHLFTVWNFLVPREWWKPRQVFPDNEPEAPPVEERFHDSFFESDMHLLRVLTSSQTDTDGHGGFVLRQEKVKAVQKAISEVFHPALQPRMIMLLTQNCPYHRDRLKPDERQRDKFVYDEFQKIFQANGIACAVVGQDFVTEDYKDRVHLTPSGGRKMTGIVLEQIHKLEAR